MKDIAFIAFINGKTKIRIKNNNLSAYLERIEASGYVVKANKCKGKEGWKDVLMIGRARDFEEFFSGKVANNKNFFYKIFFNEPLNIICLLSLDNSSHYDPFRDLWKEKS